MAFRGRVSLRGATVLLLGAVGVVGNPKCLDIVKEADNPECYKRMVWANVKDILQNPHHYPEGLEQKDRIMDFQYALYLHRGDDGKHIFNCTLPPCSPVKPGVDWASFRKEMHEAAARRRNQTVVTPSANETQVCKDVRENEGNADCWTDMVWAWTYGANKASSDYPEGVVGSADYQCVLYRKKLESPGLLLHCDLPPCAEISPMLAGNLSSLSLIAKQKRLCTDELAKTVEALATVKALEQQMLQEDAHPNAGHEIHPAMRAELLGLDNSAKEGASTEPAPGSWPWWVFVLLVGGPLLVLTGTIAFGLYFVNGHNGRGRRAGRELDSPSASRDSLELASQEDCESGEAEE
eukprot:TRINITY_DN21025_c0_g2_i1.p1 TRINITY_DN21025_c0_g2~~TRINITY_DN21025_c0_g2_i1.p1  ORF type:complete len:351 (+),score=69.61 TRINITY_DN21025_c0_g2_i1:112-1164(+)